MNAKKIVRKNFRDAVFCRDNYRCRVCGNTDTLDAHHITDRHNVPNGGYVKENGISLCEKCHIKAEQYHIDNTWETGFHPDDLYRMISSSYEKTVIAASRL